MNLFSGRPLAKASVCFLIFSVLFACLPTVPKFALLIVAAATALVFVIATGRHRKTAVAGIAICLLLVLSCGISLLSIDRHLRTASRYDGKTVKAEVTVTDVVYSGDNFGIYLIKTRTVDDARVTLPLTLTTNYPEPLTVGDTLTATLAVEASAETDRLSLLSDIGRGSFAEAEASELTPTGHKNTPRALAAELNANLCNAIDSRYDSNAASLLSAMLLGNRSSLSASEVYHFRRAGVSHLLALSGMHISILAFAVSRLTALLRIPKRVRCVILLLFVFLFSVLTGLSASILRAAIMNAVIQLASLLRRDNDSLTSLPFAAALIVGSTGTAAVDIGLWLSVFATLGILLVSRLTEPLSRFRHPILRLLVRFLLLPILFSVAATLLTLPLTAFVFGQFSLIGIPANLVFPPMMTLLLYLALISFPLPFLRGAVNLAAGGFLKLLRAFASCPSALLPFGQVMIRVLLLLMSAVILSWLFFRWKRPRMVMIPLALCIVAISAVTVIGQIRTRQDASFVYITPSAGSDEEYLLLHDRGKTVLCDMGPADTHGYRACIPSEMTQLGENDIDLLYLSHYHDGFSSILPYLAGRYLVRSVVVPIPRTTYEQRLFSTLSDVCDGLGIPLSREDASHRTAVGDISLESLPRTAACDTDGEAEVALLLTLGDTGISYTTANYTATPEYDSLLSPVEGRADIVIFGRHGHREATDTPPRYPLDARVRTLLICNPERGILVSPEQERHLSDIEIRKAPVRFGYRQ